MSHSVLYSSICMNCWKLDYQKGWLIQKYTHEREGTDFALRLVPALRRHNVPLLFHTGSFRRLRYRAFAHRTHVRILDMEFSLLNQTLRISTPSD